MNRRQFLWKTLAATGALALDPFPYHLYAGDKKKYANDLVTLGKTGIKVSRMAMGTGTAGSGGSSRQTRNLGLKGLGDLLRAAYDEGIIFWDSADQYGSHPHLKEALKRVPREKVVILTKTHATTDFGMKQDMDRFRKEIGTDYIDIMLLHCMTRPDWPERRKGAMEALSRMREDGLVKAHGVSCHTLEALKTAATTDWVQVDLARFNPAGVIMDADVLTVRNILKQMHDAGKGIIAMKVFGAGRFKDKADECLQFQLAHDCVDAFTIGVDKPVLLPKLLKQIPAASVRG